MITGKRGNLDKLMGRNAARAFAMVAMGNTAPGLAAKVPKRKRR